LGGQGEGVSGTERGRHFFECFVAESNLAEGGNDVAAEWSGGCDDFMWHGFFSFFLLVLIEHVAAQRCETDTAVFILEADRRPALAASKFFNGAFLFEALPSGGIDLTAWGIKKSC